MIGLLLNQMFPILRDKIMAILRAVDPEGVSQRRQRRLKRRMYQSKVNIYEYTSHEPCYNCFISFV